MADAKLLDQAVEELATIAGQKPAITRARKLCVVAGSRRALAIAVGNSRLNERHTRLTERLRERLPARGVP